MSWLVLDGKVLASVEEAATWIPRSRGLLGREGIEGALLLHPASSVHTFGMRFAIDVAFCDRDMRVVRLCTLPPNRITLPVRHARTVIETEAGIMCRWGVQVGTVLDVQRSDPERG